MSMLRTALFANAAFSFLSGFALLIGAATIAPWLGDIPPIALRGIGAGLVVFSFLVAKQARSPSPSRRRVLDISFGDIAWVVASFVFLLFEPLELTTQGFWAIASVADAVLLFAVFQLVGLSRAARWQEKEA